jgi:hypothetical protein
MGLNRALDINAPEACGPLRGRAARHVPAFRTPHFSFEFSPRAGLVVSTRHAAPSSHMRGKPLARREDLNSYFTKPADNFWSARVCKAEGVATKLAGQVLTFDPNTERLLAVNSMSTSPVGAACQTR